MNFVATGINVLESEVTQITKVYGVMDRLRNSLQQRIQDKFYGYKVNQCLKKLSAADQNCFRNEAAKVYERSLEYLQNWFPFDTTPLKHFSVLGLKDNFSFDDIVTAVEASGVSVNGDELYNEFCSLRKVMPKLKGIDRVDMKWVEIFKNSDGPNLFKLVEHVLCIPVSNAFVERVFSIMKNIWSDERNRMRVELVKAEICVKTNLKKNPALTFITRFWKTNYFFKLLGVTRSTCSRI
nr:PREDICTED: zinc finger protein 862-like [Latimeria chalumnae]|eukprot:XP_014352746.1 PREDICTED: zinc finger protein 862-like [Latimeria chalumnae]